jgi:hypothetical protein
MKCEYKWPVQEALDASRDFGAALLAIDDGRFSAIFKAMKVVPECLACDFFNLSLKDPEKRYMCCCAPTCIAATLSPRIISYINWKLGWITEKEHDKNIGAT